ncbi:hypothetical protein C0989_006821 [Termitomyces sp. Mn162]|nr:hypothetical protein C0989_006821 [Termitomyces sp. Mn162]
MTALVNFASYNSLPSVREADIACQAPSINGIIDGPIRDVFIKHADHLSLCLYLQHRHHFVGADEAVVKVKGTAHLMNSQDRKERISFGNKIVPTTWMSESSSGELIPMEFAVVPESTAVPAPTPAFIEDFLTILVANGCIGLFGIDTRAKNGWAEASIGNASVVVPSDKGEAYDKEKFIPVAFAFDEKKPNFKAVKLQEPAEWPGGGRAAGPGSQASLGGVSSSRDMALRRN